MTKEKRERLQKSVGWEMENVNGGGRSLVAEPMDDPCRCLAPINEME